MWFKKFINCWFDRFKEHEVEQDEPVCKMVTERKCRDVQGENRLFKKKRKEIFQF